MKRTLLILVLVLATTAACYRTRIVRGGGGGVPSSTYFHRWYHNLIIGIVDASGPVDLNSACGGQPWSEIFIRLSFLNAIIGGIVGPVWQPSTVTIYCGGGPGVPGGYALEGVVDQRTGTFYPAPKTAATAGNLPATD